jgi:hypothetical protein
LDRCRKKPLWLNLQAVLHGRLFLGLIHAMGRQILLAESSILQHANLIFLMKNALYLLLRLKIGYVYIYLGRKTAMNFLVIQLAEVL